MMVQAALRKHSLLYCDVLPLDTHQAFTPILNVPNS